MQIIKAFFFLVGIGLVVWGAKLIHSSFVHEKELAHVLKYGEEIIPTETKARYVKQSIHQLAIQLGLVILGTAGATWMGISVIKTHNNKLEKSDAKNARIN
ncbi:hypothetical protein [Aliikangiella sp. IMCC44632]